MIIETGSGVRGANSYVSVEEVTSYLTQRNRQTENSWSSAASQVKEASCISATDYLEKRFSAQFKGFKKFIFSEISAKAQIVFTANPTNTQSLTIGDEKYTFVTTLGLIRNQILIGTSISQTIDNLISCASSEESSKGVKYSFSEENRHSSFLKNDLDTIELTSLSEGASGNNTVLSTTSNSIIHTSFTGGLTGGPQNLSFPRKHAFYDSGEEILGIPENLKFAVCEYAVRVLSSPLLTDPTVDSSGSLLKRTEKIGPIETEVQYVSGSYGSSSFTPYPEADTLLRSFLKTNSSRVIRG